MTHDASHSYTYDAENRITKVDGGSTATYGYDVDGRRVSRVVAGVETDYIYDLSGRVVADYGGGCGPTCWRVGYIYLNGQMVAEYFGGTYFVHTDHLGSTRLLTGYPTASVVECDDYYPFGEQISCGGTSTTTHKFTGYERDSESGLDNAQARYNSSSLGRFMSPDPVGNFVADATNPQTWNMYAYVDNSPLNATDPTGMEPGLDPSCGDWASFCWNPCDSDYFLCGPLGPTPVPPPPPRLPYRPTAPAGPHGTAPPNGGGFGPLPPGIFATGPGLDSANVLLDSPLGNSAFGEDPETDVTIAGVCALQPEACAAVVIGGVAIYLGGRVAQSIHEGIQNGTISLPHIQFFGKKQSNEWTDMAKRFAPADPCGWLAIQKDLPQNSDSATQRKIVTAQKYLGCRNVSKRNQ